MREPTCCQIHRVACEQGCACPARGLTEAELDAAIADRDPLPDLVLARMLDEGTLAGPYRPTHPLVLGAFARLARHAVAVLTAKP